MTRRRVLQRRTTDVVTLRLHRSDVGALDALLGAFGGILLTTYRRRDALEKALRRACHAHVCRFRYPKPGPCWGRCECGRRAYRMATLKRGRLKTRRTP